MPIGCTWLTTSRKLAEKQGMFLLLLLFNRRIECQRQNSDLGDTEFYDKCKHGNISTGNIDTYQKYDWSTLRKKTKKIEHFHELLYSKADKSLLLNQLKTLTTVFPVAIRNDEENICVGFVDDIHKARSLRNAKNSRDADSEKQIIAILGKKNGSEIFEEKVYVKEGYEVKEDYSIITQQT